MKCPLHLAFVAAAASLPHFSGSNYGCAARLIGAEESSASAVPAAAEPMERDIEREVKQPDLPEDLDAVLPEGREVDGRHRVSFRPSAVPLF